MNAHSPLYYLWITAWVSVLVGTSAISAYWAWLHNLRLYKNRQQANQLSFWEALNGLSTTALMLLMLLDWDNAPSTFALYGIVFVSFILIPRRSLQVSGAAVHWEQNKPLTPLEMAQRRGRTKAPGQVMMICAGILMGSFGIWGLWEVAGKVSPGKYQLFWTFVFVVVLATFFAGLFYLNRLHQRYVDRKTLKGILSGMPEDLRQNYLRLRVTEPHMAQFIGHLLQRGKPNQRDVVRQYLERPQPGAPRDE